MNSFQNLKAWQEAHKLVLMVYEAASKFPKFEQYGLAQQVRDAMVSISSNIAEGFSRKSAKEKIHFYSIALGSLTEVQNQMLIGKDVKYTAIAEYQPISDQSILVSKLTNGLIKTVRNRPLNT